MKLSAGVTAMLACASTGPVSMPGSTKRTVTPQPAASPVAIAQRPPCTPGPRRPGGAEFVEEPPGPPLTDRRALALTQLSRDALRIPVRLQPHRDHDLLEPGRMGQCWQTWSVALGHEGGKAAALVRGLPAKEAGPAATAEGECRRQSLRSQHPDQPGPRSDDGERVPRAGSAWGTASAGRQEAEPRPVLVRVPLPAAMRVADVVAAEREDLRHWTPSSLPRGEDRFEPGRVFTAVSITTGNFN